MHIIIKIKQMSALFQHSQKCISNPEQQQEIKCRYCYDSARPLISVCRCSGTIAYVHEDCVLDWITKKIENADRVQIPSCEICNEPFQARMKIGKKKLCLSMLAEKIGNAQIKDKLIFVFNLVTLIGAIFIFLNFMQAIVKGQLVLQNPSQIITQIFTNFVAQIYVILWFREQLKKKKWMIDSSIVQIVEVTLKPTLILKK